MDNNKDLILIDDEDEKVDTSLIKKHQYGDDELFAQQLIEDADKEDEEEDKEE